jgi:hypothetical protein
MMMATMMSKMMSQISVEDRATMMRQMIEQMSAEERAAMMSQMMPLMFKIMSEGANSEESPDVMAETMVKAMIEAWMNVLEAESMVGVLQKIMPAMMDNLFTSMDPVERVEAIAFCRTMLQEKEEKFL